MVDALCAMLFVALNVRSMVIRNQELRKAEICKFLDVLRVSVFNFYSHAPTYMFNSWPVQIPIEELFNQLTYFQKRSEIVLTRTMLQQNIRAGNATRRFALYCAELLLYYTMLYVIC